MASPSPPDFRVVNMNAGRNTNSDADERKDAVKTILIEERPTLVFVQEFTWKDLRSSAFKGMGIPERFSFFGNKNSGFIYDRNYMNCERLDLKSSVRRTYGLSVAHQSSELNFDLPRLCLCKIKSIRPPEFELLCVCWHGPHNGVSDETKKSHLRSLLRFLMKIKVECGNLPLLLGGDFNLDSSIVNEVCSEIAPNLVVDSWPNYIMMWVFCSDFASTFKTKSSKFKPIPAFDHSVLKLDLRISTITENLKRSIIPINYGNRQKVDQTESFEYKLYIKNTGTRAKSRMISVSWHGAYCEYPNEALMESITSTFQFMIEKITSGKEDYEFDFKNLGLKWVLKDEPVMENIHSLDNTLQTWIFSNEKGLLSDVNREKQSVKKAKPDKKCSRRFANATPVDIHFDIVNCPLVSLEKSYVTVSRFFKRCVYLQVNSLE